MSTPRYRVRPYQPGDEQGILQLFNAVFAGGEDLTPEEAERVQVRSLDEWRWEYERNPAGQQISVAEAEDGRIVAHYACLPARMHLFGRIGLAGQGVDSMVHPQFRRGLKKEGPFLAAARHYFETWGNERVCALGYGYPNERAFRVGVRVLGYQPVFENLPALHRNFFQHPDESDLPPLEAGSVRAVRTERFGAEHDALWNRLESEYPCALVRDSTYLDWRYRDCPKGEYTAFDLVDDTGLRGFVVLRANWTGVPILAVVDLFAHPQDAAAVGVAVRTALAEGRARAQARVELWLPEHHPLHHHARAAGLDVERCHYSLCVMPYWRSLELESIREHWYFTIGDSDLF